jgi:hypothetical protein
VADHQARQKTQTKDAINLASVICNIVRTTEAFDSFCFFGGSMHRGLVRH